MIVLRQVFQRNIKRAFPRSKSTRCDEPDCDGQPAYPKKPPGKYVVEKDCCPSIFEQWKPKIPILNECMFPKLEDVCCNQPKKCFAGMKNHEKTRCQIEEEVKEKIKRDDIKLIKTAVIPKAVKEEKKSGQFFCMGQKSESKNTNNKKSKRHKCQPNVPVADWDMDGTLQ